MKKVSFFIQVLIFVALIILLILRKYQSDVFSLIAILQFFTGVYQVLAFLIMACFAKIRNEMWARFQIYIGMVVFTFALIFIMFNIDFGLSHSSREVVLFTVPWIPAVYFGYLSYIIGFEKYSGSNTKHFLDL